MKIPAATGLPGLQILRGVAASLVLIHHVLEESQPLLHGAVPAPLVLLGASGVDLFFVLSGFIMYYTNRNRFGLRGSSKDFLARRIIRIVPLYWLCSLTVVLLHFAGLYASKDITAGSVASSLLFVPTPNILLGVGWTLNYEMYFYTIFALWLFVGTRAGIIGVLATIPLVSGCAISLPSGPISAFLTDPIALEFCFGFALAAAFTKGWLSPRISHWALLLGATGLVLASFFGESHGTGSLTRDIRFLFWGIPATAIVASGLFVHDVKSRVDRFLVMLGDASYSIYLTHAFVMTAYALLLKKYATLGVPTPVWMMMPIVVSLCLGLMTYRFIEHPADEWLKARWKRRLAAGALRSSGAAKAADVIPTRGLSAGR